MKCTHCNRRSNHKARRDNLILCNRCYEEAMLENEHQDGLHDDDPFEGCPFCDDAASGMTEWDAHFAADQTSHAFCYAHNLHPKTKAGRAACRRDPLLPENRI